MPGTPTDAVRRFSRFYTRRIGVLAEAYLGTRFSVAEARVLYELAARPGITAKELTRELDLDPGYLSRILADFRKRRLLSRAPSTADSRQRLLELTTSGRQAFTTLDEASRRAIRAMLAPLGRDERRRLVAAMDAIQTMLGGTPERAGAPCRLRPHRPGDIGWVVERHGVLYAREYGWDARFEALVARVAADFLDNFDPARERCWIAERDGERAGSAFLVKHPEREGVAKLRLLLVEPGARGMGLGRRLVRECTRFARRAGYHTITLWTNSVLGAARRIYIQEGYTLVKEEPHHSFGRDLVGQTWELKL